MLEESNYVRAGSQPYNANTKRRPAAKEKSEDGPIRTAYNIKGIG
jgi:hypothetical protein